MKQSWLNGLTEEQQKEMRLEFASSALLRERLKTLLEDKLGTNRQSQISKISYDSPSWPFRQADGNGYERAINEVIDLILSKKD